MAQLVCSTPKLALLDMQFVQSYEALYQQVGALGDPTLRAQDIQFDMAVRTKCGIALSQASNPSATPPPPAPAGSDQCVVPAYQQQIALWKSMLLGPAAEEANRSIQDQVALQARLQTLGFLPPQAQIDGVFGVGTRAAIIKWQASAGRQQTGLLGDADAQALLTDKTSDSTTDAVSTPNAGQQTANSASTDQPTASTLTFSDPQGIAYANLGETTWTTNKSYDEMTDQTDISVASDQSNDNGATAQITGTCSDNVVTFTADIVDSSGQTTVNLSNERLGDDQSQEFFETAQQMVSGIKGGVGYVSGYLRVNSLQETPNFFVLVQYDNAPQIAQLSVGGVPGDSYGIGEQLDLTTTWRILADIDTDHGSILIKIPLYDPQIESFVEACVAEPAGYLGVTSQTNALTPGAFITSIIPGGPASTAGLQQGDLITQVNGATVTTSFDFRDDIAKIKPGENAIIDFLRGGQSQEITVVVGSKENVQTP